MRKYFFENPLDMQDSVLHVNGVRRRMCVGFEFDDESFEFQIYWYNLAFPKDELTPRILIFQYSWAIFDKCPELLSWFAENYGTRPQPEDLAAVLVKLGFENAFEKKNEKEIDK